MQYEEALKKARKLRGTVDYCLEMDSVWIFYFRNDGSTGGAETLVVRKDSGKAYGISSLEESAEEMRKIREFVVL